MQRLLLAAALLIFAVTASLFPATRSEACLMHPANKIALIDDNLPKAKLSAPQTAKVKELRDRASELGRLGKFALGNAAADEALKILRVKLVSSTGMISRC